MGWDQKQRYRVKGVQGQVEKNVNGTLSVLVLVEVTLGPQQGQRLRYRGYINTPENAETTVDELRVMGCAVRRLGDFNGLGSREFEVTCMADVGEDGKTWYRAAFPRAVASVNRERAVSNDELEILNAQLAGVLAKPPVEPKGPIPTGTTEGGGEIPF